MGKYVSDVQVISTMKDANGNEYLPEVYPVLSEAMLIKRKHLVKQGSYDMGIKEMICDDNYIYALSSWNGYYVRKYDINTLEMVAEIYTSTIWGSAVSMWGLAQDTDFIYVGTISTAKNIAKLSKATLAVSAKNTEAGKASQSLTMAGGKLYVAGGSYGVVSKYNPATLVLEGSIAGTQYSPCIKSDESYIYFTQNGTNQVPYTLYKYSLALAYILGLTVYESTPFVWHGDRILARGNGANIILWGEANVNTFSADAKENRIDIKRSRNNALSIAGKAAKYVLLDYPYYIVVIDGNTTGAYDKAIALVNIETGVQMPMDDFSIFSLESSGSFWFADLVVTNDKSHAILALTNVITSSNYVHSLIKIKITYKEKSLIRAE